MEVLKERQLSPPVSGIIVYLQLQLNDAKERDFVLGTLVQGGGGRRAPRGAEHGVHFPPSLGTVVQGVIRCVGSITGSCGVCFPRAI